MSQIQTGRGKWVTWEPLTNFDGSDATKASYTAWASGTDYEINDMVTTGTGATAKYWKCRVTHSSIAGDETSGDLVASKWRQVPRYTVISLRSATLQHGTSQQTATDLSEDQDPSISTELTGSVTMEFNRIDEDAVQDTFRAGAQGICTIYPAGMTSGKRLLSFNADVSSVGLNIGSDAMSVPVTLNMDGALTYGTVA